MQEYHKIKTVFERNLETKNKTLLMGKYASPEFEYLKNNIWTFTEKVDGTNIRVMWNYQNETLRFGGKQDSSEIPKFLVNRLHELFAVNRMKLQFPKDSVCLYGESYGTKIQKAGSNYRPDQSFVLFDVKLGEQWLQRKDVEHVGNSLSIDVVPVIGFGTLSDMVAKTETGLKSMWGDFIAEGIVARPVVELCTYNGDRVITKIKYKDFTR